MVQASSMPTVDRSTYEILKAKTLQPTWFAPQDSDDFFFPQDFHELLQEQNICMWIVSLVVS